VSTGYSSRLNSSSYFRTGGGVGAGGAVSAADTRPASGSSVVTAAAVRIDNFGRINEHYYRGAQPAEQDFTALANLGVKTVIDLTDRDGDGNEQRLAESAGMEFFKIAMNTRSVPTAGQIARFLSAVKDPANQPVYVHCVGGRHRTGVMTALYRMIEDGWTPDKAFQEMKSYKFGADFLHPEFEKFVLAFKPGLFAVPALPAVVGEDK
jgi:protein tyrosine/serine phosphatase